MEEFETQQGEKASDLNKESQDFVEKYKKNADQTLREYLKEYDPDFPPVEVSILFLAHNTAEDAEKIKKGIEDCDIYIPENMGWTEGLMKETNDISFGKISRKDFGKAITKLNDPFHKKVLEYLYGNNKPVRFVDVPSELDEAMGMGYIMKMNRERVNETINTGNLDEASEAFSRRSELIADVQMQRDGYMLSHLGPEIVDAASEFPELKDKDRIKVFMQMGASHTPVYHGLKKQGDTSTERDFSDKPFIFAFDSVVVRSNVFGKDAKMSEKKKALIDSILHQILFKESPLYIQGNTDKFIKWMRRIVDSIDTESQKEILKIYQSNELDKAEKKKKMFDVLEKLGIEIPKTREELDEIVATYRYEKRGK